MKRLLYCCPLTIIILTILTNLAIAQDVNLALSANEVVIQLDSSQGIDENPISNIIDGNYNSYFGKYSRYDGHGTTWITSDMTVTITPRQTIAQLNNIKYWADWWDSLGGCGAWYHGIGMQKTVSAKIYHNYTWEEVGTTTGEGGITFTGPWQDVEKIRFYIKASRPVGLVYPWCNIHARVGVRLNELEAWGTAAAQYQDIGLRVFNGTETVAIAVEPQGTLTSPLRIARNGIIYGIALVDIGDPNDFGMRVQIASGVTKALRKL